jgi:hypothetical protein
LIAAPELAPAAYSGAFMANRKHLNILRTGVATAKGRNGSTRKYHLRTIKTVYGWENTMVISEEIRSLIATGPLAHLTTLNADGKPASVGDLDRFGGIGPWNPAQ